VSVPNQGPAAALTRRFVEAVNSCDVDKVLAHVSDNHVFVDSLGFRTSGRGAVREAWLAYFKMVPDYRITLDQVIEQGEVVVAFGMATGTWKNGAGPQPENRWSTPAAWRIVVRAGQVAEWRVYADNEPLRAIARRNGAAKPEAPAA
jgi:ketosteroid isomerase-like protein